ncbi:MAG: hypothetical protein HEQ20_18890 [Aphanizomenon flos-aquae KM1D3_PB]|uniref:hypothetical protein n=1 Tax=Aphanizomenon flos-aquae TaxID=1176 RepID=UPI00190F38CE|nr:hypothetical protein [Aphanizomenon flos-aquae]QSV69389.1 MAG: hypothetical protein HEQ20_18890 [Aphanizomenon flos-aquae KM1D3_PB]
MSLWQGKRQKARGKSEEGLGDFTFLYAVWFYCVHLLNVCCTDYDSFPSSTDSVLSNCLNYDLFDFNDYCD